MKRLLLALVVSLAVIGVGTSFAHTKRYNTNVTINFSSGAYGDTFFGKVKSKRDACKRNRTVKVKRETPGTDPVYGTDTSNANGDWSVSSGNAPPGDYYAKAKRKVLRRNSNHRHICKAGRSPTISVS